MRTRSDLGGQPESWQPCTASTKRCDFWNWGVDYIRPDCCTSHLATVSAFASELLSSHGVVHWLDYGSLLGAVRDGHLIPWDSDVDFGCLKEQEALVASLQPQMRAAGHRLDLSDPRVMRLYLSETNELHVDIYPWSKSGEEIRLDQYSDGDWPGMAEFKAFPSYYLDRFERVTLEGHDYPAPSPVRDFLMRHRYGDDFLVPTRPVLCADLFSQARHDEMTTNVGRLLERLRERDEELLFLESKSRLSKVPIFKTWIEAANRMSQAGTGQPLESQLEVCIAWLERAVWELQHNLPSVWLARNARRMKRILRRLPITGP